MGLLSEIAVAKAKEQFCRDRRRRTTYRRLISAAWMLIRDELKAYGRNKVS